MKTPQSMTLLQLAMHVAGLPYRSELWTSFDRAARDEYDRRILKLEAAS